MSEFILNYKGIKTLPDIKESGLIKKIHLEGSKLYDISSITKNQYPQLTELYISKHKHIKEIFLLESTKMEKICIHTNKIAELKNIHLLKTNFYKNLQYLHISNTYLTKMIIFQGNCLQTLNVSHNKIKIQENCLLQFPALKYLDLKDNYLTVFPDLKAPLLRYYDISQNKIKDCQNFQKQSFDHLQYLDFSCNYISQLPKINLPSLKILNKRRNIFNIQVRIKKIQQLQEDFYPNIQEIYLKNNLLNQIPILKCNQKLKILNFQQNVIKKFQKQTFPQLKQLFLSHNKLQEFPLIEIPEIQILQIGRNLLRILPRLKSPKLNRLNINYNKLENINQFALGEYPSLTYINFQSNKLEYLPKFNAVNLKLINLQDNFLKDMQQFASVQYPELATLKMGDHNIYYTDKNKKKFILNFPYINAPKLQILEIQNAGISDITRFLEGSYPKLTHLSFLGNKPISIVPQIQASKLSNVNWGEIKNITQFLQGNYPYLRYLTFQAKNTFIISSPKKTNHQFQYVNFDNKGTIQINKIPYIKSLMNNLSVIKIDNQMTTNTQFLSYINLYNIKEIQFNGLDKTKIIRSLTRINFSKYICLTKIKIIQNAHYSLENGAIQRVMYQKNRKNSIFIEKDEISWRRIYKNYQSIQWSCQIKTQQQYNYYQHLRYNQFVKMLNGTKLRMITDSSKKKTM